MHNTRPMWGRLLVAVIVCAVALGALGCPSRQSNKPQAGELVGQLPGPDNPVTVPAVPAPVAPAPPAATAGAQKGAAPEAAGASQKAAPASKLSEEKFIALSAKLVLAAKSTPDTEQGRNTLEAYTMQVLKENDVTVEEFRDFTAKVHEDPVRQKQVTERILATAEKYASPRIKMRDSRGKPILPNMPSPR